MGFFKDLFKAFTMSTEEIIAESNREIAKKIKDAEGLDYKRLINKNNVWGIEKECGNVESIMLFSDRLRFRCQFKNRDLLFKDIINFEVLTDTQIEEKSKLGQFVMIGAMALATKPKTEEKVVRRLVINASEYGINFSIIIDTLYDPLTVAKELSKELEEYRSNNSVEL